MKLYFAMATNPHDNRPLIAAKVPHLLFSYYYFQKGKPVEFLIENGVMQNKLSFLDSGAFSAFTLKKTINIKAYCDYIKKHDIKIYATLDAIGDPEESIRNEKYIEDQGLNPIKVFHTGENVKYLDRIIDSDCEHMALGGMVMAPDLENWLDHVFEHIYKRNRKINIHGFGLTNPELLLRYPWYSADSSSWAGVVRFARFSYWNDLKHEFFTRHVTDVFRENGFDYSNGEQISGEKRIFIIGEQIKHMQRAEQWLNSKHESKDFQHLAAQMNIMDIIGNEVHEHHPEKVIHPEPLKEESSDEVEKESTKFFN